LKNEVVEMTCVRNGLSTCTHDCWDTKWFVHMYT